MTQFKVRLVVEVSAGTKKLRLAGEGRAPRLVLDQALPWRERVETFALDVLGQKPTGLRLSDIRSVPGAEPELHVVVECRVARDTAPRDDRLAWSGGDPPAAPKREANLPAAEFDPAETLSLYTDGGSRGNPGPAGVGVLLCQESSGFEEEFCAAIGRTTNNVAEYTALIEGLSLARERGARRVRHYSDSELLVRQLEGRYKVKSPELRPLYEQVLGLADGFESFRSEHVRRELNSRADSLANRAMDEAAAQASGDSEGTQAEGRS